jgi:DMSO/TMAO reductase YedYZ molybdopterin-dependent catalytic subunit
VRWEWAVIPEQVDVAAYKIAVGGHVNQPISLSLADLLAMPRVEVAAICQCSGNSRGFFSRA